MLKIRLIPTLLLKESRVVKGSNYQNWRDVGNPVTSAKIYDAQGADELFFLDITATSQNRQIIFDLVSRVADECFMPLTIGGGVRTIEDIRKLLSCGADKVAVNTAALRNPGFIAEAAGFFGSQCIVVCMDVKKNGNGNYEVFACGGKEPVKKNPVEWARQAQEKGAGEILVSSIDRDGTMQGYDTELIRSVSDSVTIPVIAAGGAGKLEHFVEAVNKGGASAVAAGSLFNFTDQNLIKTRAYMKTAGLNVRSV